MAKDNKDYQSTIEALMSHGTYLIIINKLIKVYSANDDEGLKNTLFTIIGNAN